MLETTRMGLLVRKQPFSYPGSVNETFRPVN